MKKITKKQTVNRLQEYIPKGCRKARTRIVQEVVSLSIKQVDESEAPVAFICHDDGIHEKTQPVRIYRGKFYALDLDYLSDGKWKPVTYTDNYLCFSWMDHDCDSGEDYLSSDNESKQRETLANKMIIGDKVYYRCGQPYYGFETFGVGVSWCFDVIIPSSDYMDYEFSGISPDDKVMLQRKYDELMGGFSRECGYKSLDDALRHNYIEVLMPDCCKRKFQSPIYDGDKWYKNDYELQKQLTQDLMKTAERLKKKYAAHFEYLSNFDFSCQFDFAADVVRDKLRKKVG